MENFVKRYYDIFKGYPTNVLEIGSRDGHDAHYMKTYFDVPDNRVYIVEPNPPQAQKIRLSYPNYKVYEFAISESVGILQFNSINCPSDDEYLNKFLGMSSLLKIKEDINFYRHDELKKYDRWINVLSISGKMLLDLIGDVEYDIVKIDVEGATFSVLKSFGDDIKRIKYIHMEAEQIPIWENEITYDVIYKYMIDMGFKESYRKDYTFNQCDTIWYNTK